MSELHDPSLDLQLSSYDYKLPDDRIAQNPVVPRDRSRLLVVDSPTHHTHSHFYQLPQWLQPNDLLILNDSRVIAARLYGQKSTGASVEVLLLEPREPNCWLALVKPGKRFTLGATLHFSALDGSDKQLQATILERDEATGGRVLQFHLSSGQSLLSVLGAFGQVPFPPYVTATQAEADQYQTVYACKPGSVAAPTAGLHFTPELMARLQEKGIRQATITLHVGVGTFRPVEQEAIAEHTMHQEWLEVPDATVEQIQQTRSLGGRVIAVGTTAVRALETAGATGKVLPFCGKTDLFIYPGYRFRVVDGLITNFHLPKSSLLMLVSAAIGRQRLLQLYQDAIACGYRFYSFGDAMLILPQAQGISS